MPVINTNYLSLVAQNNLTKSQNTLGSAIEKLSSGLRINSAKDDAAGQAIANRFTANVKGLTQAARNANDGISIAQTTEGALNEINNNLQRVRELTVQATTGTNSKSDLQSIQAEIDQRLSEIDRVSSQTQFNGVKVLAGGEMKIQVGANDGETISINLKEITSETLSLNGFNIQKKTAAESTDVKSIEYSTKFDKNGLDAKVEASAAGGSSNGKVFLDSTTGKSYIEVTGSTAAAGAEDGYYEVTADAANGEMTIDADKATVQPTVNNLKEITRVNAEVTLSTAANMPAGSKLVKLGDADGKDLGYAIQATDGKTYAADITDPTAVKVKTVDYVAADGTRKDDTLVQLGGMDGITEIVEDTSGTYKAADIKDKSLATDTVAKAATTSTLDPLKALDSALAQVDSLRSDLGAVQNRFQSTVANLNNTVNNLSAARSRIEDADYATEVSNMSKAQILQQAGTSVLAQANQVPQSVLSLLQ